MAVEARTRSDMAWARGNGILLIVGSVIAAVACYVLAAVMLPSTIKEYERYEAADACPATVPVRPSQNCLRTVTFTVKDTLVKTRGPWYSAMWLPQYEATLSGTSDGNGVVEFGDPGPVLKRLRPGDRVSGIVWRGSVMRLTWHGVEQATADEPRDEPQMYSACGVTAGLLAALSLWFGLVQLIRPHDPRPCTWPLGRWLLATVLVAGLGWGCAAFLLDVPWQAVAPVAVALTVVTSWALVAFRRRRLRREPIPVRAAMRPTL